MSIFCIFGIHNWEEDYVLLERMTCCDIGWRQDRCTRCKKWRNNAEPPNIAEIKARCSYVTYPIPQYTRPPLGHRMYCGILDDAGFIDNTLPKSTNENIYGYRE